MRKKPTQGHPPLAIQNCHCGVRGAVSLHARACDRPRSQVVRKSRDRHATNGKFTIAALPVRVRIPPWPDQRCDDGLCDTQGTRDRFRYGRWRAGHFAKERKAEKFELREQRQIPRAMGRRPHSGSSRPPRHQTGRGGLLVQGQDENSGWWTDNVNLRERCLWVLMLQAVGRRIICSVRLGEGGYAAPAFSAYSQEAFDSGTVRAADSMALALAAVPSRMRPAMPCVMQARRNRL